MVESPGAVPIVHDVFQAQQFPEEVRPRMSNECSAIVKTVQGSDLFRKRHPQGCFSLLNVLICGSWLKGGEFLWRILFEPCFDTIPDCLYGHVFLLFLTAFLARSLPSHSNPSRNFWKRPGLLSFVIRVANLSVGNGQSFG
jgi:hypothetical protein